MVRTETVIDVLSVPKGSCWKETSEYTNSYRPDGIKYEDKTEQLPTWRKCWTYLFPFGLCVEFKQLVRLAIPIAITSLFSYAFGPVSIAFCGHLGKMELATIGLSMSVFNVAGMFVITGLLTASDTIFAQTYGSTLKDRMSSEMRKSFVLITLFCVPSCALFMNIEPLLLLLHQNPIIAKSTGQFLVLLIPALLNHVVAPLIITVLTNLVNALLHYLMLYQFQWGLNGSALAQTLAYLLQDVLFVLYIQVKKDIIKLTADRTLDFLANWGDWTRLALPGLLMVTLEWTLFEIGGFVAGTIGDQELAAQTVLLSLSTLSYTLLPHGFGVATGIRVGQYLGGGVAEGPRSSLTVALVFLWCICPFYIAILISLRWYIPVIFTRDPGVIAMVAGLFPLICGFQIMDSANGVCSGVFRGAGLQHYGALINFASLYIIGAPLGLCLVYLAGMSIEGIWIGLIAGTSLQIIIMLVVCYRMDWNKQVDKVMKRLNINEEGGVTSTLEKHPVSSEGMFISLTSIHTALSSLDYNYRPPQPQEMGPIKYTWRLIATRLSVVGLMLVLLCVSITCRFSLDLSAYFGPFCVFPSGTFLPLSARHNQTDNCTLFVT